MNNRLNIRAVIAVVFIILSALAYFIFGGSKKKHDWNENYKVKSAEPFGTSFIYQLLEKQHPHTFINSTKPLRDLLSDSAKYNTGNNYVFVGGNMFLNPADSRAILDFVQRGNNAFIGSCYVPEKLIQDLYDDGCDDWQGYTDYKDSVAVFNFFHPSLYSDSGYKYKFAINDHVERYNWQFINGTYFCKSSETFTPIGYVGNRYGNFAAIPYGKGTFYLYTTPLTFTNYYMRDSASLEYAEKVFSHLNSGPVIWDEYSKLIKFDTNLDGGNNTGTPLSYILSQPGLRYAWYLLILGAILYIVFMARRRQRVTAVVEPNTNTSLSYINTISSLYYTNANHIGIAHHKMKYFNAFVRSKYNITLHGDNEEQIISLSKKSQVPLADIHKILNLYKRISLSYDIGEESLIDLHNAIENFYTNCK